MGIRFTDSWDKVIGFDIGWHVTAGKRPVGKTFKDLKWELILLGILNVQNLMIVLLSTSSDSHLSVEVSQKSVSWLVDGEISVSSHSKVVIVSQENATSENRSLNLLSIVFARLSILLRNDTTKSVTGNKQVVTIISSILGLTDKGFDLSVHFNWVWNIKDEIGNTNKHVYTGITSSL